jgi:hypothetical protein
MKKIIAALLAIVSVIWIYLSDFEVGKYDSFEEVLEKGIPYKVKDVIHIQNVDGVTVVMYTTEPNHEADYDALAVAFLEGNDEDGWENIGPNGWSHYDNDNITIYNESLRDYDEKGNLPREFYVVFGEINNSAIARVEMKNKQEEAFEEATIITHEGKRYYFHVGRETIVRALSENGQVIEQHGG